jgi:hypothetical protein
MGNDGKPTPTDIAKINNCLDNMDPIKMYVQNESEHKAYPKMKKVVYDGHLLPFERVSGYMNNGLCCDSIIHLFREPPLIAFARERNQITTIPRKVLAGPLNQTESNLRLEDYLLGQIAAMKRNRKYNRKMLFTTIFEHCNITTKKQKQRAPGKIERLLTYYKKCEWIKGHKTTKDGVTISV